MPYVVIWQYELHPTARAEFERLYGSGGAWADLFRRSGDYLATRLLRDVEQPSRYVTFDLWRTGQAAAEFNSAYASDYAALDARCAELTVSEIYLGAIDLPDG